VNDRAILFVDDEQSILNSLKRLLRKEPYTVHTALDGPTGLEILSRNPSIQVVVSDQRMPGMRGTDFLAKVKAAFPETVRIVLSGFAEASTIVEAINQGEVYRFVAKPWQDEDLKATFRQCLDHYDIIQENKRLNEQTVRQMEQLKNLNTLLESSVEERTRCLSFSQEVLDNLPMIVLGISNEEEIVLTNCTARAHVESLSTMIPGTEMEEILPEVAVRAIRECMTSTQFETFDFTWEDRKLKAHSSPLGSVDEPRGCVLLLEEI